MPKHLADRILSSRSAIEGERKQVTVLFADLKGSMELLADRDPEDARKLLDPVLEKMIEAVHRYEGTVNQVMGDGIMALFGAPLALEDHAVRACYSALAMQSAIKAYGEELRRSQGVTVRIRVGLNSGEVVVRAIGNDLHMDYTAVGQTTHLAARMEQLANPDATLLTAATLQLVEGFVSVKPQGPVPVKGLTDPVEVYELIGAGSARSRLQAAALRGLTKFVGRSDELMQMHHALEQAHAGHGQLIALVGEPGVGKSRLVWEFVHSHRIQGWLVLESSSVSYGKANPYRPVIDLLKNYFQIEERDDARRIREKVAGKLLMLDRRLEALLPPLLFLLDTPLEDPQWDGLDPSRKRARILDACKRLLLREAQLQPLVLVFEDLHWIDSETQALLDSLVESLPSARMLLLVNYRPEYQHRWGAKTYYTQLRIDPLGPQSAESLLQALLGDDQSLDPLKRLLSERTGGNPLFLEEGVRSLVETGTLIGARGSYRLTAPVTSIEVPASVQVIIAARIDRLPPEDKRLLQAAAAIGNDVPFVLLQDVAEMPDAALRDSLGRLQAAEFVYETALFPDLEYQFKHALTHEVAYGGVLRERRLQLHARIVEAIEHRYRDRLAEHADHLGYHALRAEAWKPASQYLHQAGIRAYDRSALRAALSLAEQALIALDRLPREREELKRAFDLHLLAFLCWDGLGDFVQVLQHAREAERLASELDDETKLIWACGSMASACSSVGDNDEALRQAERADRYCESSADPQLKAVQGFYPGMTHAFSGRYHEAVKALALCTRSLRARLDSSDPKLTLGGARRVHLLLEWAQAFAAWCLAETGDFADAIRCGQEAVDIGQEVAIAYPLGFAMHSLGAVYVVKGDVAHALSMFEQCGQIASSSDAPNLITHLGPRLGHAYKLAGRVPEAVATLEDARDRAHRAHNMAWLPLILAHLSDAYRMAGRLDDALTAGELALELSCKHKTRGYGAWALHYLGEVQSARSSEEPARAAYEACLTLTDELGMRPLQALCHLGIGQLFTHTGERELAQRHLRVALAMTQSMEMDLWQERAQLALQEATR